MKIGKKFSLGAPFGAMSLAGAAFAAETTAAAPQLEQEWDKVFPKSEKVEHKKVLFKNRYGITLAADMYIPKDSGGTKLPPSPSAAPSAPSRSSPAGCTPRSWPNADF